MSVFISVKDTAKLYEWWSRSLHVCGVTLVVFIPKSENWECFSHLLSRHFPPCFDHIL